MKKTFFRAVDLLIKPEAAWAEIASESHGTKEIVLFALIIVCFPALAMFIGYVFVGLPMDYGYARMPVNGAVLASVIFYVLSLLAVFAVAFMISMFCRHFKVEGEWTDCFKLAVYSATAPFLTGGFYVFPVVSFLKIIGFYGVITLFSGLPIILKIPKEKELYFVVNIIVFAIIIMVVFFGLVDYFLAPISSGIL